MSEISYDMPTSKKFNNLSGQIFGRLTVLEWNHKVKYADGSVRQYFLCRCDCGNNSIVSEINLKRGSIISCGCYRKENTKICKTKHGLRYHPLYNRCNGIIQRCYNENLKGFKNYGGRDKSNPIYLQDSWKNDFRLMVYEIESEIGLPPFEDSQIDRIDNMKGYESGNIRWVNAEINIGNRRNSHNHSGNGINKRPTQTYNSWKNMLRDHKNEVCSEWLDDGDCETANGFRQFLNDMGEKPYLGYKKKNPLMRYDDTKPWCRENCYWS